MDRKKDENMKTMIKTKLQIIFFIGLVLLAFSYPDLVYPANARETKIWLIGDQTRTDLLIKNISNKTVEKEEIVVFLKRISQNGRKGVRAYNVLPKKAGGSYVFIEMSDRLLKEEGSRGKICEGQKKTWYGFLKQFKNPVIIKRITNNISAPEFLPCDCESEYVPIPPYTLKTSQVDEEGEIKGPDDKDWD